MDYLLALLFGVVEGLTEFLPVSSTAHIRLTQFLCGIKKDDEFWKMFAVVIQLGAILAVVVFFWARLVKFVKTFPQGERKNKTFMTHPLTLIFVACVVTSVPALLLLKRIGKNLESATVMGLSLIIGGIIMWIVDVVMTRPKIKHVEDMGLIEAIWIGLCQIFAAVFPGTSRSMATIAGGQLFGMSRQAALEFSFLLSIPIMIAATLLEMWHSFVRPSENPVTHIRPEAMHMTGNQWGELILGTVVSFFVAWAVIAWFMHWVRRHGFVPFAIYRIVVGTLVIVLVLTGKFAG